MQIVLNLLEISSKFHTVAMFVNI